jgi:hypothetical protein
VNTCERCGADAVDARGVCQNCGWQRRGNGFTDTAGTPSLGETRAADVMPMATSQAGYHSSANQPLRGTNSGTGAGRYCGACGAPIEPGQAFCGQCGTPVPGLSGGARATSQAGAPSPSNPSRYRVGDSPGWHPDDGNAPTEEIRDMLPPGGYGRSGLRMQSGAPYQVPPYSRSGYGGTSVDQPAAPDTSRTLRMILGVMCLVGSLISAVAAIVLAVATIH